MRVWASFPLTSSRAYPAGLQGLVAGLNAARRAQGLEPVAFPRTGSYIGTLIDDLVTKARAPKTCELIIEMRESARRFPPAALQPQHTG